MNTLVMDTAWKNLVIALFEDGNLVEGLSKEAFKKQSESLLTELEVLLRKAGWSLKDIDEVIVTDGPGSYTGLRIAMTTAKILGTQSHAKVRTISTLQLYAGTAPKANVILDARASRAYVGHLENGVELFKEILPVEDLPAYFQDHPGVLYGEGELIGQTAQPSDFLENARALLPLAKDVENVDALTPCYMKESQRYLA